MNTSELYERFDESFERFKRQYISLDRVMSIEPNQFGTKDITVLFYDKRDKSLPLSITSWEGYPVDVRGMIELQKTWENIVDFQVLNNPASWEQDVSCKEHYNSVSRKIAEYELRK